MIDLHCHVLPGVDDGPDSTEAAVAMARAAEADGIDTIAATPHVTYEHRHNTAQRIAGEVLRLQAALDEAGVAVRLVTGAEVAGSRAVDLPTDELARLTIGGGQWLLLECPLSPMQAPGFERIARSVMGRGLRVLLAHPERSPATLRGGMLDELVAEGALAQITAGSLSGEFGRTARQFALAAIDRGSVHVVASDGHGTHRPARMTRELAAAGIDGPLAEWLTEAVPAALLAGGVPPSRPSGKPLAARPGPLSRLVRR